MMFFAPRSWRNRPLARRIPTARPGHRLRLEALEERTLLAAPPLATAVPVNFPPADHVSLGGVLAGPNQISMYQVQLGPGDLLTADIHGLQSALRIFNQTGQQLGLYEPGGNANLAFQATAAGNYYLGVSASGNDDYDPTTSPGPPGDKGGPGPGPPQRYNIDLTLTPAAPLQSNVGFGSFRVHNNQVNWGDSITGSFTVENTGGADAGSVSTYLTLSTEEDLRPDSSLTVPVVLQTPPPPDLAPGQTYTATFTATLPNAAPVGFSDSGPIYLGVVAHSGSTDDGSGSSSPSKSVATWTALQLGTPAGNEQDTLADAALSADVAQARLPGDTTLGFQISGLEVILPAGDWQGISTETGGPGSLPVASEQESGQALAPPGTSLRNLLATGTVAGVDDSRLGSVSNSDDSPLAQLLARDKSYALFLPGSSDGGLVVSAFSLEGTADSAVEIGGERGATLRVPGELTLDDRSPWPGSTHETITPAGTPLMLAVTPLADTLPGGERSSELNESPDRLEESVLLSPGALPSTSAVPGVEGVLREMELYRPTDDPGPRAASPGHGRLSRQTDSADGEWLWRDESVPGDLGAAPSVLQDGATVLGALAVVSLVSLAPEEVQSAERRVPNQKKEQDGSP